ncbi:hypothetical protein KCU97_g58, partial [Aureobasidium melanogenum]
MTGQNRNGSRSALNLLVTSDQVGCMIGSGQTFFLSGNYTSALAIRRCLIVLSSTGGFCLSVHFFSMLDPRCAVDRETMQVLEAVAAKLSAGNWHRLRHVLSEREPDDEMLVEIRALESIGLSFCIGHESMIVKVDSSHGRQGTSRRCLAPKPGQDACAAREANNGRVTGFERGRETSAQWNKEQSKVVRSGSNPTFFSKPQLSSCRAAKKAKACSHQPEVVQYRRHSAKRHARRGGLSASSKKKRGSLSSVATLDRERVWENQVKPQQQTQDQTFCVGRMRKEEGDKTAANSAHSLPFFEHQYKTSRLNEKNSFASARGSAIRATPCQDGCVPKSDQRSQTATTSKAR